MVCICLCAWVIKLLSHLNWPFEWLAIACTLCSNKISLLLCSCSMYTCVAKSSWGQGQSWCALGIQLLSALSSCQVSAQLYYSYDWKWIHPPFQDSCYLIPLDTQYVFFVGRVNNFEYNLACYQWCCLGNGLWVPVLTYTVLVLGWVSHV